MVTFTMDVYSHIIGCSRKPEMGCPVENNAKVRPLSNTKRDGGQDLADAPIAQRTRAPVFGTGGRGFESL